MALPNGTGGYQLGDGNLNETTIGVQAIPTAYTAAATLTVLNLEQAIVVYTSSSTADLALPTAASVDAELSSLKVNSCFDIYLLATSTGVPTLTAGTGWTPYVLRTSACERLAMALWLRSSGNKGRSAR